MELNERQMGAFKRLIRETKLWEESRENYYDLLERYIKLDEVIEGTPIEIPEEMFTANAVLEVEWFRQDMERAERKHNLAFQEFMESK